MKKIVLVGKSWQIQELYLIQDKFIDGGAVFAANHEDIKQYLWDGEPRVIAVLVDDGLLTTDEINMLIKAPFDQTPVLLISMKRLFVKGNNITTCYPDDPSIPDIIKILSNSDALSYEGFIFDEMRKCGITMEAVFSKSKIEEIESGDHGNPKITIGSPVLLNEGCRMDLDDLINPDNPVHFEADPKIVSELMTKLMTKGLTWDEFMQSMKKK